jgi:hypothetical protein
MFNPFTNPNHFDAIAEIVLASILLISFLTALEIVA